MCEPAQVLRNLLFVAFVKQFHSPTLGFDVEVDTAFGVRCPLGVYSTSNPQPLRKCPYKLLLVACLKGQTIPNRRTPSAIDCLMKGVRGESLQNVGTELSKRREPVFWKYLFMVDAEGLLDVAVV